MWVSCALTLVAKQNRLLGPAVLSLRPLIYCGESR